MRSRRTCDACRVRLVSSEYFIIQYWAHTTRANLTGGNLTRKLGPAAEFAAQHREKQ